MIVDTPPHTPITRPRLPNRSISRSIFFFLLSRIQQHGALDMGQWTLGKGEGGLGKGYVGRDIGEYLERESEGNRVGVGNDAHVGNNPLITRT